jgi:hypothetical protein
VTLIARAEAIQINAPSRARLEAGITWTGVVRQRLFRGSRNVYTVQVGPHRISVDASPEQPLTPGTEVTLTAPAAHAWVVRV